MENIIINFTSDAAGLQPGIEGLDQIMESDKAVADQAKKTMEAYSKRDKSITDANNNSKKSIDGLATSIKNLDKTMIGGIGGKALDDLRATLKLTDGQWKQFYTNLIKTAKAELVSAKQKEDIEQLNQLINGAEIALKKMAEKEELVNTTSKSMKAELRALKQELQQMEDQGRDNTAEFEQMAIKAGKLEDQIGDTNARIKALGSDTFVFDALISGVTGLTGAFAAVQGAAALFGDENEDLQRVLLKVNAAMSMLQGLQAVQNVLQKQSAASIAVDLVLRRSQTVATTAQTLATEAQAAATTTAAAAQTGLNTAMKANPVGMVIAGIAAIATAVMIFGNNSSKAKKETISLSNANLMLADVSKKAAEAAGEEVSKIEALRLKLNDMKIPQTERVRYLKDYNEIASETNKIDASQVNNLTLINQKINEQNGLIIKRAMSTAALSKITELSTKAIETQLQLTQKLNQYGLSESDRAKVIAEWKAVYSGGMTPDTKGMKNDIRNRILIPLFEARDAAQAELQKTTSLLTQYIIPDDVNKEVIKPAKDAVDKVSDITETNRKAELELLKIDLQQRIDYFKAIADNEQISYNERLIAARIYYTAQQDLVKTEFAFEYATAGKTAKELELLTAQTNDRLLAIEKNYADNRRAIFKKLHDDLYVDEEKSLNDRLKLIDRVTKDIEERERQRKAKADSDKEKADELKDYNSEVRQAGIESAINLTEVLMNLNRQKYAEEAAYNKKLFDNKKLSQEEYDKRVRELRRKQVNDEKKQTIFAMLLQQGPMIAEGFKKGNLLGAAMAAALFFSLLGVVISTDTPQFRYGGMVDGPGTGTSDSIPIRVSKGEYITRYEQTAKHKAALDAINEGRYDAHLMNYELPRLYQNMQVTGTPQFSSNQAGNDAFDYEKMADAFAKKLEENPQAVLSVDEEGFMMTIRKGNTVTNYKNKKLTT